MESATMAFLCEKRVALPGAEAKADQERERAMAGQGMRLALKGSTPSAHARLRYITRQGKYAQGIDGDRDDLAAVGSANLPNWASDADQFWQGVDQFERSNARRCVELELNLPPELNLDQQKRVVETYALRLLGTERMPHTWAIHDSGTKNPHVHLMFQERGLDGIDRIDAQAWFKRANSKEPAKGGAKKSRSITGAEWTMQARAKWAEAVNDGLKTAGYEPRFDHRSKAVQRDEALRSGDLRRAALLGTLTERHEGATVSNMRRRISLGEVEVDDLPQYAGDLILLNDRAREYNNALRDWVRTATDVQLAKRLAPDLVELREQLDQENPGAHVAAWQQHQVHLANELERDHALGLLEWVQRSRTRAIKLKLATSRPTAVDRLDKLKRAAQNAANQAHAAEQNSQMWRQGNALRAKMADLVSFPLYVDQVAENTKAVAKEMAAKLRNAPEIKEVFAWEQACLEFKTLQEQLPRMERAAGLEPQIEQDARSLAILDEATLDLKHARGKVSNNLSQCAVLNRLRHETYDEEARLHEMGRQIDQQHREVDSLRQSLPAPNLAEQVRAKAAQSLANAMAWKAPEHPTKTPGAPEKPSPLDEFRPRGPRMR